MTSEAELFYLVLLTLMMLIIHLILSTKHRRNDRHSNESSSLQHCKCGGGFIERRRGLIGNSPLDSTSGKGQNDGKAALKCRLVTNFAYHRRSRRRRSRTNHKLLKNSKRKTILLSSRAQPLCYRPICIEKLPKSKPIKESRHNGKCCMANQAMRSVVTSKICQKRCSQWRPMHAPVRSDS